MGSEGARDEVGIILRAASCSVIASPERPADGERRASSCAILARIEALGGEGVGDEGVCGVRVGALSIALDDGSANKLPCCGLVGSASVGRSIGVSLEASDDVLVVVSSSSGWADASPMRARCKARGNSRPRFSARRKIPAAALGLK